MFTLIGAIAAVPVGLFAVIHHLARRIPELDF